MINITNNENKDICSSCGGKCCKRMGCHLFPNELPDLTKDGIVSFIKSGNISIDWWDGDDFGGDRNQVYYLRIRNKHSPIIDASWGGECSLLTDEGCSMDWNSRPACGKCLVPSPDFDCVGDVRFGKKECCAEWYKYQDVLDMVVKEFE